MILINTAKNLPSITKSYLHYTVFADKGGYRYVYNDYSVGN